MSQIIILKDVEINFAANIFVPKANKSGKLRYSAVFPIVPNSINARLIDDAIKAVATDCWGPRAPALLTKLIGEGRVAFKKAEKCNANGEVYDGFQGMWFIGGSSDKAPLVINRNLQPVTQADSLIHSGCRGNVKLELWAQDSPDPEIGKRINSALLTVQYVAPGEQRGGGSMPTADGFEDLGPDPDAKDIGSGDWNESFA